MHIPDGFLAPPVWATLDAVALPAVAVAARRAQRGLEDARIPLLGVMGAFVFAAQMINFPVGVGTSGHLVGGALLACTLGPASATVVMAAILAIQALVLQDGGILALGANLLNMAVIGVLAGYLPYRLWGAGRLRKFAIFAGGALSVLASAVLALAELLLSGVRMAPSVLGLSLAVFLVSALLEGAITLAVLQALEAMRPGFVRRPAGGASLALGAVAVAAVLLSAVGVLFASTAPDGIERVLGVAVADASWLRKAGTGLVGLAVLFVMCTVFERFAAKRSA
ncbi:MAG TPA: energy-coupling factor ABC transporter permease [Bryobacteraceae bacterium]|nr:energy-coupling factor ABC transporter permease [Bryobacteraceae bacterium]